MAVTTKKTFPATTNATTTVFSPVGIQLNNQDDLDVYVTLSGGTRVLQLRQSTGSTATSSHKQVNDTTGLYFPAVTAGTTLYNYTLSTDNNTITFNSALPSGAVVSCERRTRDADSAYTSFASGSTIRATDLNNSSTESNFTAQDARNKAFDLEGKLFNGPADGSIKTKLDGIEANATQDQTASEIRALVESASDSNVFTDDDHSKLNAIEAGATTDQTAAEIRALVESASDSHVFTDDDHNKLNAIEANATADQTAAEIRTLVENANDSNVFTDNDHDKLNNIAAGADVTSTNSINALTDVNTSGVADGKILKYDASSSSFIIADDGGSGSGGASAFTGLSDTPANYGGGVGGKVLKVNTGATGIEFGTADLEDDTTPSLKGNLDVEGNEITTTTSNGNIKVSPNGTGLFEVKGNTNAGTLQLNCENNSHGVKIKSPAHSASASYTLTLPQGLPSGSQVREVLRVDSSGVMDTVPIAFQQQNQVIALYDQASSPNQKLLASTEGVTVIGTSSAVGKLMFRDLNTANKVKIKAVDSLSGNLELTLPAADGTAGQPLQTNGSGVLSFADIDKIKENDSSVEITGTSNNTGIFEVKLQHTSANSYAAATSLRQWNNGTENRTIFNEGNTTRNSLVQLNHQSGDNAWSQIEFNQTGNTTGSNKIRSDGYSYLKFYTDNTGNAKFTLGPASVATLAYDFIPNTNNTKDLGSTSFKWAEVHATTFYGSGANLTDIDAGATGSGNDKIFWENGQTVTQSYTVGTTFGAACNAMSAGPITINNSVVVTVDSGDTWTIV